MRTEIDDLYEKAVELRSDFPELTTLDAAKAALLTTSEQADRLIGGEIDGVADNERKERKPKPKPKAVPRAASKPARPKRAKPTGDNYGARISWQTGREVLSLLAKAPDGMLPEEVGKELGLTRAAARFRLEKRLHKGHVKVDPVTKKYVITTDGRAAFAKDEDNDN
jgi:hypothetical protein